MTKEEREKLEKELIEAFSETKRDWLSGIVYLIYGLAIGLIIILLL